MSKKAPKPYDWDQKTISALRKVWRFSPERRNALDLAKVDTKTVQCNACGTIIDKRMAVVDHVEPVVPVTGFDSWDGYISRLKSPRLQVLCEGCHGTITKAQNALRRENRLKKGKKHTSAAQSAQKC